MNSQVRSLVKPKNHMTWLRFGLKSNWQQFVFYAIVMLLACVVTSIIGIESNLDDIRQGFSNYYTREERGGDLFKTITLVFSVVSCVLGVFSGMTSTGYVNSRKAVHCYHSLPLSRDALYLTGGAVQGIYYLVSALCSVLIGLLMIVIRLGVTAELLGEGLMQILAGIGGYLVVFTLFQLAGALTGTAIFRFIMAGIIAFLPVVLYLLVYWGVDIGMSYILAEKYTNFNFIRFLCPAVNIYCSMAAAFGELDTLIDGNYTRFADFLNICTLFLTAAVYYGLGLLLNRKRRSELSESSVLWKKLQTAVKYPVIFVAGAGGAVFFRALFGTGVSWMIFGGFCGLVLSFLLMNVLISKNTKSMFKGLPGLGITAAVVAVFLAVIPFDVFGFNYFMYDTDQVKSVTVYYNDMELELDEPDEIHAVMPYIEVMSRGAYRDDGTVPADEQYANETAFWIDTGKILNQNKAELDTLKWAYADRAVSLGDGSDPVYIWMSGMQFNVGYYDPAVYMKEYAAAMEDGKVYVTATSEEYGGDYSFNWERLEVSVYPKFGLPIHRFVRVGEVSENAAIYDTLHAMTEYKNQYTELGTLSAEDLYTLNITLMGAGVDLLPRYVEEWTDSMRGQYCVMLDVLMAKISQFTPDMAKTPVIGTIHFGYEDTYKMYPIYAGMTEFLNEWANFWEAMPDFVRSGSLDLSSMFPKSFKEYYDMLRYTNYTLYEDAEEIMDWVSSFHRFTYVIEADTGRSLYIDENQRAEVLENAMIDAHGSTKGEREKGYLIVSTYYRTDEMMEGLDKLFAENLHVDGRNICCLFRKDAVPQFVLDAFAK